MSSRLEIVERANQAIEEGWTLEKFITDEMGVPSELIGQMVTQMAYAMSVSRVGLTNPSIRVSGNVPKEVERSSRELKSRGINRVPVPVVEQDEDGFFLASVAYLLPTFDQTFLEERSLLLKAYTEYADMVERKRRANLVIGFAEEYIRRIDSGE